MDETETKNELSKEEILKNKLQNLFNRKFEAKHELLLREKKTKNAIRIGETLLELHKIVAIERKQNWHEYVTKNFKVKPFMVNTYMCIASWGVPDSYYFLGIEKLRRLMNKGILSKVMEDKETETKRKAG